MKEYNKPSEPEEKKGFWGRLSGIVANAIGLPSIEDMDFDNSTTKSSNEERGGDKGPSGSNESKTPAEKIKVVVEDGVDKVNSNPTNLPLESVVVSNATSIVYPTQTLQPEINPKQQVVSSGEINRGDVGADKLSDKQLGVEAVNISKGSTPEEQQGLWGGILGNRLMDAMGLPSAEGMDFNNDPTKPWNEGPGAQEKDSDENKSETKELTWTGLAKTAACAGLGAGAVVAFGYSPLLATGAGALTTLYVAAKDEAVHDVLSAAVRTTANTTGFDPAKAEDGLRVTEKIVEVAVPTGLTVAVGGGIGLAAASALGVSGVGGAACLALTGAGVAVQGASMVNADINTGKEAIKNTAVKGGSYLGEKVGAFFKNDIARTVIGVGIAIATVPLYFGTFGIVPAAVCCVIAIGGLSYASGVDKEIGAAIAKTKKFFGFKVKEQEVGEEQGLGKSTTKVTAPNIDSPKIAAPKVAAPKVVPEKDREAALSARLIAQVQKIGQALKGGGASNSSKDKDKDKDKAKDKDNGRGIS